MMFNDELILIEYGEEEKDEWGNKTPTEIQTPILCSVQMVNRSEYYQARLNDLSIEVTVMIHPFEYGGQKRVDFRGRRMSVLRTNYVEEEGIPLLELQLGEKLGESL